MKGLPAQVAQQTPAKPAPTPTPQKQKPGTPLPKGLEGNEEEEEDDDVMLLPEDEIPFQRIEFLVRDWMDFEEDLPFHKLKEEMDAYLQEVIEKGGAKDLKHTRDQILSCFQKVWFVPWLGLGAAARLRAVCNLRTHPPRPNHRCGASSSRTRALRCPRRPTPGRWSSSTLSSAASSITTPARSLGPSSRYVGPCLGLGVG